VVFGNEQLTYHQLNCRANQLAHYLQSLGVKADALVGICVERSLLMLVGLLGILKAGGAYLPLDPEYPQDRLSFMLEDAQIKVLLTQQQLVESIPQHQARVVCLDSDWEKIEQNCQSNPLNTTTPDNLAYVIYTSGSTGKPKGVLVNHCNVVRLFTATNSWYNFKSQDVWTMFHSYAFDFSVWEIWGALLYGGKLVVVPYLVTRSPESFYQLLCQEKVTILNQTPSAFRQLIQAEQSIPTASDLNLRLVIFGGEALEPKSLQPWFERHGDQSPQLVNMYGITETTVHVTYRPLNKADLNHSASVIGHPIPDLQVYVLDKQLQPVPVGVPGEMYIGGAGLARGYLNRAELTQQKFIPNPFSTDLGSRLYKTGDLARYLPDGNIEYIGRIDNQVKIRGFRIELGEIEALLSQHGDVQTCCVIAREDTPGDKRLVAYLVPHQHCTPTSNQLRQFLKAKLPEYMVPQAFVILEQMPLTPSGKVDRRGLQPPSNITTSDTFVAPRNKLELQIAQIWSKVLKLNKVGVKDNFFDLGGHSLLTPYLMAQIKQQFGKDIPLVSLYQNPTIEQLATIVQKDSNSQSGSPLVALQPQGSKPPLFCLPGAGGDPFYFYHLSCCLGLDQPFYSFQANALFQKGELITQVEDVAAHYIQALLVVQPQGPYFLAGHSFGGQLAFEMAQQLLGKGHKVALVIILDTSAPSPQAKASSLDWNNTKWLAELAKTIEVVYDKKMDCSIEILESMVWEDQLKYVVERLKNVDILPPDDDITHLNSMVQLLKANCSINYVPQKVYPTKITLLRAKETVLKVDEFNSESSRKILQDLAWGWNEFSAEPVDVHFLPGNHTTMMFQPHVQILAERLKACIEQAHNFSGKV
jgi:amino acid adenylation domain-containing protein